MLVKIIFMLKSKVIFHLDADSYFVSAIRTIRKDLFGKSMVVAHNHKRAIITSASYEAKAKGIKVGMPLYKAKLIDPNVVVADYSFELYSNLSSNIFNFLYENYTKKIQIYSIDEFFIDASDLVVKKGSILKLAQEMQKAIMDNFSIPFSIGVGPNLWMAKMSTSINKPYGITITKRSDLKKNIYSQDISEYVGIGKSGLAKLSHLNIKTIGDFCNSVFAQGALEKIYGIKLKTIKEECQGISNDQIDTSQNDAQSLGSEISFSHDDLDERSSIFNYFKLICELLEKKLKNRGIYANTLTVKLRDQNYKWKTKRKKYSIKLFESQDIMNRVIEIFNQFWDEKKLRGLGISLSDFGDIYQSDLSFDLFDQKYDSKKEKINALIKSINKDKTRKVIYFLNEYQDSQIHKSKQSKFIKNEQKKIKKTSL
ncbi:DNA-DAMAGE REPAIR PROTEIN MUCB [Mycoplasmopsis pulmonis]|uniref:DNA-DAMAGE REPAIR PROTEIN MUCB n=2 Tax=Mycoplasmopsis pulmonis TaxID=2107 RepID=Q98R22_MYCPU|nr:DNA-DAMAGE REPAIR PROTEIN MUCB [Mycoplasmopsis pulmonis]VEU67952.1 DNA polymerase IV [Mycoplasmopsis pulmonis]